MKEHKLMKENVLDILMYLFEHCVDNDSGVMPDVDSVRDHLGYAGFQNGDIEKAFAWLEGLSEARENTIHNSDGITQRSTRIFTTQECNKLNLECRGFLLFLEQSGILDPISRELVIDRAMALEGDEIDLMHLKWVILMVLFNQPGQEAAYAWMEDLLFEEVSGHLH